jgi:hypothetical protein
LFYLVFSTSVTICQDLFLTISELGLPNREWIIPLLENTLAP